ncbi:MAG: hypothetical protein WCA56_08245, partial [Xanthobacteraceae bacterium]
RQRGMQMVPQYLPPSFYGIAATECAMDEDYCARVLAAICQAVVDHYQTGGGALFNYRQLPDAVGAAMPPHFSISCSEEERASMQHVTQEDAKSPSMPFAGDTTAKQRAATENIRRAAERHLGAIYERLEDLRTNMPQGGAASQLNVA